MSNENSERKTEGGAREKDPRKTVLLVYAVSLGVGLGLVCAILIVSMVKSLFAPRRAQTRLSPSPSRSIAKHTPKKVTTKTHSPSPIPSSKPSPAIVKPPAAGKTPREYEEPDISPRVTDPREVRRYLREGVALYRERSYERAAEIMLELLKYDPRCYEAWLFLGKCKEMQKLPSEAAKAYRRYIKKSIASPERIYFIASIFEEEKEYKYAIELYKEGLREKPGYEAYYRTGYCYYVLKDYRQAISYLEEGRKIKNDDFYIQFLLAESYKKSAQRSKAMEAYRMAYALKSREILLLYEMGSLDYEMGNYKGAESYLREYVSREADLERKNRGKDLLRACYRSGMKTIPPQVEEQSDTIPGLELTGISMKDGSYRAIIKIENYEQEYSMGQTILNKYYILDINDNRVVLKFLQSYYVLRPD